MIEIMPLKKLNCEMTVPGSKYIANRAIIIASLCKGTSRIENIPDNEDIESAIRALTFMGVDIKKEKGSLIIDGSGGVLSPATIDVKDSGTLLRFIIGTSALAKGTVKIDGSKRIGERPIIPLLESLKDLGISSDSNEGFTPVNIHGGTFIGGKTRIKGDVSSQFISSLLAIAPFAKKDVEIMIEGELVSKEYVAMTIDMMREFGVVVKQDGHSLFKIKAGQRYAAKEIIIPGDWSSASYFLAAAAIVPGCARINGMDFRVSQGEKKFADLLVKMGCMYRRNSTWIQLYGLPLISDIDIDMGDMPDVVQTLAIVACYAEGKTRIRNIGHLRHKESDRIRDTATELRKTGINVEFTDTELIIEGGMPKAAVIDPHNDHRTAMSFAILGLKCGMKIKNPECVNKSFPGFWDKLKEIGAEIRHV
ncbi:MAG: 3-phosphoshikimate 1-carboxyvinyltransferase [Candidatus Woesearchaeota archaeon]|nr:3-phosphoshikimate 1-carboxyvinyltransferase [Candidatus Woesearchaeota archaeon]